MQTTNKFILWGAVSAFLAVAIGAFGAHGLEPVLEEHGTKATFETGVQYHIAHALALLFLASLSDKFTGSKRWTWAGTMFLTGMILFSGSLYILSVTGIKVLGAITPLGGVAFLTGWTLVAMTAVQRNKP
ncbi:membrane protein [Paenibacillus swuensis]|uniref:Membrane protein n=1 Tax=Paenibacillus swuensis TaxID=1178515 RepID=A0A172TN37_9BACL|nr:DUF423 domain-containing protein [Paenibacillus swuensis]ANE48475.1 membrane protein [Paenibacillus swuensis]